MVAPNVLLPGRMATEAPRHTVLVLDCDGDLGDQTSLVRQLRERGYGVVRATDGHSALWMMSRMAIDLVVVDLCATNSMEFLHEKSVSPALTNIPVLLVTVGAEELVANGYANAVAPTMH